MKLVISSTDDPQELGERILNLRVRHPNLGFYNLSELVDGEASVERRTNLRDDTVPMVPVGDLECHCLYHEEGTYHSNPECPFFID